MTEYKSFSTSRKSIEEFVLNIKKAFKLENQLYFPIVEFIEYGLPRLDPKFNYEIVEKSQLIGRYAEVIPSEHTIYIREDVYEDACNDMPRARFTLCHEVGHYLMHNEKTVSLHRLAEEEKIPTYQNPEWQANVFAGYLLMTPDLIRDMPSNEICKICKVSKPAVEIQMKFL